MSFVWRVSILGLWLLVVIVILRLWNRWWPKTPPEAEISSPLRGIDVVLTSWICLLILYMPLEGLSKIPFLDSSIKTSLLMVFVPLALHLFSHVSLHQLGMHRSRGLSSIFFGTFQVLVWGPPVILVSNWVQTKIPPKAPHPGQLFLESEHVTGEWIVFFYCLVVAAPLWEELFFRAILQTWLRKFISENWPGYKSIPSRVAGPVLAIAATSLLFGLAHYRSWPDPIPLTLLGVGLGITYQRTRSLWAPVAMHAAFNASNIASFFLPGG